MQCTTRCTVLVSIDTGVERVVPRAEYVLLVGTSHKDLRQLSQCLRFNINHSTSNLLYHKIGRERKIFGVVGATKRRDGMTMSLRSLELLLLPGGRPRASFFYDSSRMWTRSFLSCTPAQPRAAVPYSYSYLYSSKRLQSHAWCSLGWRYFASSSSTSPASRKPTRTSHPETAGDTHTPRAAASDHHHHRPSSPVGSTSSVGTNNSRRATFNQWRNAVAQALQFLDERAFPLGFFTAADFQTVQALLIWFRDSTTPHYQHMFASYHHHHNIEDNREDWELALRSVDVTLKLWLRSLEELAVQQPSARMPLEFWYWTQPDCYSPLLNHWKEALRSVAHSQHRSSSSPSSEPPKPETLLLAPLELWDKLHMYHHSDTLSGQFTINTMVLNILLKALILHSPPHMAPEHAEARLEWIEQQEQQPSRPSPQILPRPSTYTYNHIFVAWVHSGRRPMEVWSRVQQLWQRMRDQSVTPNLVSYRTRLRAIAAVIMEQREQRQRAHFPPGTSSDNNNNNDNDTIQTGQVAQQVESILQEMVQRDHLQPDVGCLFHLVMAYTAARQFERAHQVLDTQFFHRDPNNKEVGELVCLDRSTITEAALFLLQGYRDFYADSTRATTYHVMVAEKKKFVMLQAERLVQDLLLSWIVDDENDSEWKHPRRVKRFEGSRITPARLRERVLSLWLDLLALAGRADEMETLLEHGYPGNGTDGTNTTTATVVTKVPWDAIQLGILFKAYGRAGTPERALQRLRHLVANPPPFPLDVSVFNSAIVAWAQASLVQQPPHSDKNDAMEEVAAILDLLDVTPGLQPNARTFYGFLKCLARTHTRDAGAYAEQVLNGMERAAAADQDGSSSNSNENVRYTVLCYNLALQACYNAGDLERTLRIMERMERVGSPPNLRTYQEILVHYSSMGTVAAAERCEAILENMGKSDRKPDSACYNIALGAWIRTMDKYADATDRMWKLYQHMQANGIERTIPLYQNLLIALTKRTDSVRDLDRAEEVLASMECCDGTSDSVQQSEDSFFTQTRQTIQQARNSLLGSMGNNAAVGDTGSKSNCSMRNPSDKE